MDVVTAAPSAAAVPATPARPPLVLRGRVMVVVAIVVAALSLLLGRSPTYDVWAWLVWGREIAHLDLDTTVGPSWKPLPILVAAVLSPTRGALPDLWLVIARAGGLLAVGGAARLAWRVSGPYAAAGAAAGLISVHLWLGYLLPYGMSEPLLAATVLWAVDRHLDGRRAGGTDSGGTDWRGTYSRGPCLQAWWLAVAAALLRPETWPFLILYGLWLLRRRVLHPAVVGGGLLIVPLAWFVPQGFGSGQPFRLGQGQAAPGGPQDQAHPGAAALGQVPGDLPLWVDVGAVLGLAYAVAVRDRLLLALAGGGLGWALIVAGLAEFGSASGVSRYMVVTHAAAAVLAGVGWVETGRRFRAYGQAHAATLVRGTAAVAVVPVAAVAVAGLSTRHVVHDLRPQVHDVRHQEGLRIALPRAVAASGGRAAVLSCGKPWVGALQLTFVAWELKVHFSDIRVLAVPGPPPDTFRGSMLQTRDRLQDPVQPQPFPFLTWRQTGQAAADGATWTVLSPCPPG